MTATNPAWDPRSALLGALADADLPGAFFGPRGGGRGRRGRPHGRPPFGPGRDFAPDRPDITVNVEVDADGGEGPERLRG
ncbi:hypothetical protein, partial [Pseudonocardia pini]|uniref:hypothetical protein n=1 Tax=Pseudonocardia pini TaxID=2758030 RepID=UPI001C6887C4